MKILYLHQYFSTPNGSSGLRSYEFARALVARGHEVTVFCVRYDGSCTGLEHLTYNRHRRTGEVDGIEVVELELLYSNTQTFFSRIIVFLNYALGAIREACKKKYDLVFATSTPLTVALPGIFANLVAHKKFIFEVRDLWPELPRAMGVIRNPMVIWLMEMLEKTAYRSAIGLVGLSPGIIEGILLHRNSRENVTMIPNACDDRLFNPEQKGELQLSNVKKGDFTAIFSGTVGIANGVEAVLSAAEVLRKRGREDIKLLLFGKGNRRGGLEERARNSGLTNCLFFDPVPKEEIARVVASASVGLMILADIPAFYYGTSPNKFFDYIASGIPVINNYPGWIAEMITENGCGFTPAPGDAGAFADALCTLADDDGLRVEMGKRSFSLSRRFLRADLAGQFCDFIEKTALGSNSKSGQRGAVQ